MNTTLIIVLIVVGIVALFFWIVYKSLVHIT
jgi:hypothetical protein